LYDAFLPEYYWTEVMECLRKLLLTGFVVFFYERSALQIVFALTASVVFLTLYSKLEPYLMPSNNSFATFVHFNISFTLTCTLLIRAIETFTQEEKDEMKLDKLSVSYALLFSNISVLVVGFSLILKVFLTDSKKDYTSVGFNEEGRLIDQAGQLSGDDLMISILKKRGNVDYQHREENMMLSMEVGDAPSLIERIENKEKEVELVLVESPFLTGPSKEHD